MEFTDSTTRQDLFTTDMAAYLVERYLPDASLGEIQAGAERLARAGEQIAQEGTAVTYLGSTFIPGDDAILDLILAPSTDAVSRINERAGTNPARVSGVILITPLRHRDRTSEERDPESEPGFLATEHAFARLLEHDIS